MNDKVIVITRDGNQISLEEWQRQYGLPVRSNRIGEFFYLSEWRFAKDIQLFGELIVNEQLIRLLDEIRKACGQPLYINSFNRTEAKQEELRQSGARAATFSPHVVRKANGTITGATAADIDTHSEAGTRRLVKCIQEVSAQTGIRCRIGYEQYLAEGSTFVHVDVCPEYYAPGKPWHNEEHPPVWELTNTW